MAVTLLIPGGRVPSFINDIKVERILLTALAVHGPESSNTLRSVPRDGLSLQ